VGLSYASVPLYRMFCQLTGYGGTIRKDEEAIGLGKRAKAGRWICFPLCVRCAHLHAEVRPITVRFNSDVSSSLPWKFRPLQSEVVVVPGATMLAFFRATNTSDSPVVGVSSYNVQPSKAGVYFTKVRSSYSSSLCE